MSDKLIISADSHVFEPINLWEERLDKRFQDKAPRFIPNYQDKPGTWFVCEGLAPKYVGSIAAPGLSKSELSKFKTFNYKDLRAGGYDPVVRLKDQDMDGIVAEVLYPTWAMGLYALNDAAFQEACFNAYNDWLAEFCSHAPERLAGLALISMLDVDKAVKSLTYWMKRGLKGAMIAHVPPVGPEYSDKMYDPFWAAAAGLGAPLSLHLLTSARPLTVRVPRGPDGNARYYAEMTHSLQMTIADILGTQMLDRNPKVKFVIAESDTGWIPHLLARLDRGHDRYATLEPSPGKKLPSENFRCNVAACFIQDRVGIVAREFIGVDNLMWSSDYPHTDSTWPESRKSIEADLKGVSAEDFRKMTYDNAAKLYGFKTLVPA